jgi:hypothetical protein
MNHLNDEQMILYYYGESDNPHIGDHLSGCGPCRAEYQRLQRSLALATAAVVPERPPEYEAQLWERLRPQLSSSRRFCWTLPLSMKWAFSAVIAASLAGAFLLGRYWTRSETPVVVQQKQPAPRTPPAQQVLLAALANHLEESEMVLMELTHVPEGTEINIAAEQALAREVLNGNRIYRQSANRDGETGLGSFLEDLERILLEIVQSPSTITSAQIEEFRTRIQAQGILFKLRILSQQVRERQIDAARELSRRSS